jgi:hypothetical protein
MDFVKKVRNNAKTTICVGLSSNWDSSYAVLKILLLDQCSTVLIYHNNTQSTRARKIIFKQVFVHSFPLLVLHYIYFFPLGCWHLAAARIIEILLQSLFRCRGLSTPPIRIPARICLTHGTITVL